MAYVITSHSFHKFFLFLIGIAYTKKVFHLIEIFEMNFIADLRL